MKTYLTLAFVACCSLAAPVQAATLDIMLGQTLQYSTGLDLAPTINLAYNPHLHLDADSYVVALLPVRALTSFHMVRCMRITFWT